MKSFAWLAQFHRVLSSFMKSERGMGFIALIFSILVISAFVAFSIYLIKLDNIVREKFEGQRWDIPAKVFARPMEV